MEPAGQTRLEALAKDLASGQVSRRSALGRLFGATAALVLPGALFTESALARCPPSRKCGDKCCPSGQRCRRGKCKCKGGLKKCGKKCVNVSTDAANCGSCGRVCPAGQGCVNGQCTGASTTEPVCGNGKAEGAEICDGADLKGATCQSLGFVGGVLRCTANCTYDMSGCTSPQCNTAADCPQGPAGDCQKAVCTSGTCGFEVDNADAPSASGQCTRGTCVNGVPAQANVAAGTACAAGVCNGQGACVGCNSAADCPQGPAGNCEKAVCVSGTCGFGVDNTDVPADDGNPCTVATCSGGIPSQANAPADTVCGSGMVCNGSGQCVGCNSASQCPQPTNPCQVRVCNSGTCGFATGNNGNACDTGNLCITNGVCSAGVCSGTAVTCSPQDQCHNAGTCDPSTGACSNPTKPDGTACTDGNACTQADFCQGGVCVGSSPVVCTPQSQCHTAGTCNPSTGQCSNPPAAAGTTCSGGTCDGNGNCVAGACTPGAQEACYDGPAGTAGVGVCQAGTRTCNAQGTAFGPCVGQVLPTTELCNGQDDDCDGVVDEGFNTGAACVCSSPEGDVPGVVECSPDGTGVICNCG